MYSEGYHGYYTHTVLLRAALIYCAALVLIFAVAKSSQTIMHGFGKAL